MGLFGRKQQQQPVMPYNPMKDRQPYKLRQGTSIAMVNVPDQVVTWARTNWPRVPKFGHEFPVELTTDKKNILITHLGQYIGILDPKFNDYYWRDINGLTVLGQYGETTAAIKWDGAKTPHCVFLNWGSGAADGGIL
jgi:hypothetical protein